MSDGKQTPVGSPRDATPTTPMAHPSTPTEQPKYHEPFKDQPPDPTREHASTPTEQPKYRGPFMNQSPDPTLEPPGPPGLPPTPPEAIVERPKSPEYDDTACTIDVKRYVGPFFEDGEIIDPDKQYEGPFHKEKIQAEMPRYQGPFVMDPPPPPLELSERQPPQCDEPVDLPRKDSDDNILAPEWQAEIDDSILQPNEPTETKCDEALEDFIALDKPDVVPVRMGVFEVCPDLPPAPPPFYERPKIRTPDPEDRMTNILNLVWSFGLSKSVPVINLTTPKGRAMVYTSSHTAVIYNFTLRTQVLLQGHGNMISCMCASSDKRWIATGDKGPDSMVIVWDSNSGVPVKTLFDCHPDGGVSAVAITPDARYLATMSAAKAQTMAIWDWTLDTDIPLCTAELRPAYGIQSYIYFNPEDITQLVSNSESQVIFYCWQGGKIEYYAPPLTDKDFNKAVGRFSQSIYFNNSTRALTATSLGNLVVWEASNLSKLTESTKRTPDKKALKIVRIQDKAITVLTTTEQYIVTAGAAGTVRFLDQTLKLIHWYQDLHIGPLMSISFEYAPDFNERKIDDIDFPFDATVAARPFRVRDSIIGAANCTVGIYTADNDDKPKVAVGYKAPVARRPLCRGQKEKMEEVERLIPSLRIILQGHDAAVHAISSHPQLPQIVIGSYSGLIALWDYNERKVLAKKSFDKGDQISCCTFDPNGKYIAVGFTNGKVRVLDALSLHDLLADPFYFKYANDHINTIAFSHDTTYIATADVGFAVTLFRRNCNSPDMFLYCGRNRAHYKPIRELLFGVVLDSNKPRLLSLGEDRLLVEYDLDHAKYDSLDTLSSDRIEQSAVPLCMTWYPSITKENFLLTANDQYKFKLYNTTTRMCRRTVLGPTYGSPIDKLLILPPGRDAKTNSQRHLAYIINDKIGIGILPLDGNPHNTSALIAHPRGVTNMVSSLDGRYIFSAGGVDGTVHMWKINYEMLHAQARLGGEGLVPFYGLLDGGRKGALFHELEDYFYYAQIRSQGIDAQQMRNVSNVVQLVEVPFIMRALGYYPSEQEIEEMLNEVKYGSYVETGEYTTEIDIGTLIKLFINHRPVFGLQAEKLKWAFEVLGYRLDDTFALDRGDLLDILQNRGESMTEDELADHLSTLLGYNEGRGCDSVEFDSSQAGEIIEKNLATTITADMFAHDLLGFSQSEETEPEETGFNVNQSAAAMTAVEG